MRPKDFYGFEDWTGGDPQDDIDAIKAAQARWDAEHPPRPWIWVLSLIVVAVVVTALFVRNM